MNIFLKSTIALSLLYSTSIFANIDYSKCAEFLNPKPQYQGLYGNTSRPYLPFELKPDGKVNPHKDVISYKNDKTKNQEVIVYEMPYFEFPSSEQSNLQNPFKQKMRRVSVRIQRDENGNISEIVNDQNISQAEIDKQVKLQKDLYLKNTPPEIVKQHQQMSEQNGVEFHLPFQAMSHETTKFEIKNGQCVPLESKSSFLIEPKVGGNTHESNNFNTNLCKDINDFLSKNPEAAACFKKDLNQKMSSIFSKYSAPKTNNLGMGMGMGGYPWMGSLGGIYGFGMMTRLDSHLLFNSGTAWGNDEQVENYRKMSGTSPVITGHMILQDCQTSGLTSFIEDTEIWKEQANQSVPKNDGNSSSKEI